MTTRYTDSDGMIHTISEPYRCIKEPEEGMLVVVDCRGRGMFSSRTMSADEVPEYIEKRHLVKLSSD